jgi:hypothetical protein
VAPLAGSSTLGQRTIGGFSGGEDTADHWTATRAGFDALVAQPFGRGLGTAPGVGNRFDVSGTLTAEDSYLQVGDEDGVVTMAIFIVLLALLATRLVRAPPDVGGDVHASALGAAAFALMVGGLFLHVWLDFSTALLFWGCAGIALPAASRTTSHRVDAA